MQHKRDKQGRLLMRNQVQLLIPIAEKNYSFFMRPTWELCEDGEIVEIECKGAWIWPQEYLRDDIPWLIDDIGEMIMDYQNRKKSD